MFKKIPHYNFMQQVKSRIQSSLVENLKEYKSRLNKIFFKFTLGSLVSIFIGNYLFSHSTPHSFIGFFPFLLCFVSVIALLAGVTFFIIDHYYIKKMHKNLPVLNKNMETLLFKMDKKFFNLTTEEIQHLFSLHLIPNQLTYLKNTILEEGYLTFADLEQLSSILSDEENKLMKEREKEQHLENQKKKLADFVAIHDLSSDFNAQLLTQQFKEETELEKNVKEIGLNSRL